MGIWHSFIVLDRRIEVYTLRDLTDHHVHRMVRIYNKGFCQVKKI